MIRGEPLTRVGLARPHVDFLVAENQRRPFCLARARIEYPDLHAEYLAIPLAGARHVGDIDDDVIERIDLDRHGLSLGSLELSFGRRPGACVALAALRF